MIFEVTAKKPFTPFPKYDDRAAWDAQPADTKKRYEKLGKELKGHIWNILPASLYMEFKQDGNRSHYENVYFARRNTLFNLVMAECFAGTGEYLNAIIDGVWAICEETTWVVPAHNSQYHNTGGINALYSIENDVYIDLFAAETGSLIGWIYYFLKDQIAAVSETITRRIELEVHRRILQPYMQQNDFAWSGLDHDNPVNNWNPWINSNILVDFLIFSDIYPDMLQPGISKTIRSINRFLHFYHEDGGCDEGPAYFNVAGASVLDFIEELGIVADVGELYKQPLIRNIAAFIYKVYIGDSYFVNYADATPRAIASLDLLARTGEKIGDNNLIGAATHLRTHGRKKLKDKKEHRSNLFRELSDMFYPTKTGVFNPPGVSWFPGIQVVTAREKEGSFDGLFFSAKAGNNNESHNHNDVGTFLLFCDNVPVLVDAGVETYTRFTFSDQRYTLWTMQSGYHNLPTINGYDQLPGLEHCGEDVEFNSENGKTCLSMELRKAYPEDAGIESYKRSFVFSHSGSLTVTDSCKLTKVEKPLILNFLCYEPPVYKDNKFILSDKVSMKVKGEDFSSIVEDIPLTDPRIYGDWEKDFLYRLRLTANEEKTENTIVMKFKKD